MNRDVIRLALLAVLATASFGAGAELPEKVEDGVMLHCYGWPFSAIEVNLDRIAAAGFNAIQVSPVQRIREPSAQERADCPATGPWWLLYQPVSFASVGNYKLGTEGQFRSLCEKAEANGIKIIVDVVLNHVADTGRPIKDDHELDPVLRDLNLYHDAVSIACMQDRRQLTQRMLGTLPDLKTQDQRVQDMHVQFLNHCIDLGADGFRFDAAKHIETDEGDDEDADWEGDYWRDVLGRLNHRDRLYLFGEVLQDTGDNRPVYESFYDITCHNYGGVLRQAIQSRDVGPLGGHRTALCGIRPERGLAYVENHDDYEHDHSRSMPYWDRKMAGAFLIARAGLVPRVLDRPEDDIWEDPDIMAVNHLRNAVTGTGEFLRFPSRYIAIVERGNRAVVIINLGDATDLDVETRLVDGTYANQASMACTLEVAGHRLKGRLPGGAVFASRLKTGTTTEFRAAYDTGWGHSLYIRGSEPPLSWSRGIQMQWTDGNVWLWRTESFATGTEIEFKVLIDDERWEIVDGQPTQNHTVTTGGTAQIHPVFP